MAVSNAELKVVLSAVDNMSAELKKASGALHELDKSAAGSGKTLAGLGEGIAKLTTTAAVGAVAGLAVGLGAAVKSAADFEHSISGIVAVSGAGTSEIDALRQKALDLGAATKFSATEAAVGMEELIKAGVSMTDVMGGGARAALDLAAAGEVSVGEAAKITSNALNAFGLSGDKAAAVADTIAGAANASAIDVHEFGFSLAASGAVAATVGLSFDDLAQGIAVMGQAGIKGSDAGTSLKTMLLNLQPVTDKQVSLFHELGLITEESGNQFFDANGKIKGMADIAQVLQNALGGLTEEQRLATLEVLFGSDAIRAGAVLTKAGAAGFNDMAAAMGKVSAQQVAEERLNNVQGSLEKLKGSLETAAIVIGSAFLPALKHMIDGATEAVNAGLPQMQEMAQGIADGFTAAVPHVVTFFSLLSEHGDTIKIVAGALASLAVIVTVTGWITGAIAAFSALGTTIAASSGIIVGIVAILGGPITVVVFAIVAAVVLLAAAWATNFGDIQGKTAAVVSFLISAFQTVVQAVTNGAATLNAWSLAIATALNTASMTIVGFLNTVGAAWTAGWAALTATLTAAWAAIQIAIDLAMAAINLAITLALGLWWLAFVQPLIDIYTLVTTTFTSIMTWLNETFWIPLVLLFTTQLAALSLLITTTWTTISTTTTTIWTAMSVYFLDTFWNPLAALVTTITATILQVITTAWTAISTVTVTVWTAISTYFMNTFWNPLAQLVTTTTAAIQSVITTAWNAIQSLTQSVWNAILQLLTSIFGNIHAQASAQINPIPGIFSGAWNAVKSGIDGVLAAAGKAAAAIFKAIQDAAKKATDAIKKFMDAVSSIKLPDFLKLGSPPELAVAFDFISDSIGRATSAASSFGSALGGIRGGQLGALPTGALVDYAREMANKYGVPADMFIRQINQESGFNPMAGSGAGAQGIAQFMPGTAAAYGVNPWDPISALEGAARHMADLFRQFGSWELALAAYNAGAGAVQQYGGVPPFAQTQHYLDVILGQKIAMPTGGGGTAASAHMQALAASEFGKPYVWGGKSPATGFDCSGFVSWVYAQMGVSVPSFTDSIPSSLTRVLDPKPGDVVMFKYNDPSQPGVVYPHTGIYMGDGKMMDSQFGAGTGIHNLLNREMEFYRAPGFATGGIVPGALGDAMMAMVHGGEMVLTPGQQAALLHGSAGGGGQIVINVNAPVYGVNDMESVVIGALDRAQRRGRL